MVSGIVSCTLISMNANSDSCEGFGGVYVIYYKPYGVDEYGNWHGPNPEWEPDYSLPEEKEDPCEYGGCDDDTQSTPPPKEDPKACN